MLAAVPWQQRRAHNGNCCAVDEDGRRDDASNHGQRVLQAHENCNQKARLSVYREERRRRPPIAAAAKGPNGLHGSR